MSDTMHGREESPEGVEEVGGTPAGTADRAERGPAEPSSADRDATADGGEGEGVGLLRTVARGLVALVILGLGVFAAFWFNWTEGEAQSGEGAAESARLVETVTAERGTTRVTVRAMGTVIPAREVVIRPRVSGKIIRQSEAFVPGGHFEEGEFMVQIDRADYEHTLEQSRSELERAQATLEIEKGDQAVAREELELFEGDIPEANRALILRKPQVNQAKASVKSAEAAVDEAQLDLDRTRLTAPFDGHLVSRSVTAGNNVSEGDQLATFVGSDHYWVRLSVPVSHVRWIDIPGGSSAEAGSRVRITNRSAWGPNASRSGRVTRMIGQLEANSRRAQVLVRVDDPLAQESGHEGKPTLILDSFVDTRIRGRELEDAVVIDRNYLRTGGVVWVMNDSDRLETHDVTVAFLGQSKAYLSEGLEDGDRVVKTNLASPVDGMLLRTAAESGEPGGSEDPDGEGSGDA